MGGLSTKWWVLILAEWMEVAVMDAAWLATQSTCKSKWNRQALVCIHCRICVCSQCQVTLGGGCGG